MSYASISKLSCDNEDMYRASTGYRFILVVIDKAKVIKWQLLCTLYRGTSHKIGEALINYVY